MRQKVEIPSLQLSSSEGNWGLITTTVADEDMIRLLIYGLSVGSQQPPAKMRTNAITVGGRKFTCQVVMVTTTFVLLLPVACARVSAIRNRFMMQNVYRIPYT